MEKWKAISFFFLIVPKISAYFLISQFFFFILSMYTAKGDLEMNY